MNFDMFYLPSTAGHKFFFIAAHGDVPNFF